MFKHLLVGAFTLSSLAFAAPPMHGAVPLPPPPPAARHAGIRMDDTRQATALLRAFDDATARRDLRAIRAVDMQFSAFLQSELREARMQRGNRNTAYRLTRIESELARLQGRVNPRALSAKRDLYVQLTQLADTHPNRRY